LKRRTDMRVEEGCEGREVKGLQGLAQGSRNENEGGVTKEHEKDIPEAIPEAAWKPKRAKQQDQQINKNEESIQEVTLGSGGSQPAVLAHPVVLRSSLKRKAGPPHLGEQSAPVVQKTERWEAVQQANEREKRKHNRDVAIAVFKRHQRQWDLISTKDTLCWSNFPWPMFKQPSAPEEITWRHVHKYLTSRHYPEKTRSESPMERIQDQIKRWDLEHFEANLFARVVNEDRDKIRKGVGRLMGTLDLLLTEEQVRLFCGTTVRSSSSVRTSAGPPSRFPATVFRLLSNYFPANQPT